MAERPGARRYRIRIYYGDYELLPDRIFVAVLDLDTGYGMRQAEAELNKLLPRLARRARIPGDQLHTVHLVVCDWSTDEELLHWAGPTPE